MRRRSFRKGWLVVLAVFVGVGLFTFLSRNYGGAEEEAEAASLANFDAGYIISDYQMGNYNSMSVSEIAAFLRAKGNCNYTNLIHGVSRGYENYVDASGVAYNYRVTFGGGAVRYYHVENGHFVCLADEKFNGKTAAEIIYEAAQDYRINPQALIVLLQKEQSLITDNFPNNVQYRSATGYGCPDTAACNSEYYGFRNQVRKAAALFRTVLDGGWTNYPLGVNYVQYNPNAACGGSAVNIRSLATSALYRYTPYQPNASAIAAGYGTGDGCGAYGNRNFYLYFYDWFGDPTVVEEVNPNITKDYKVSRGVQVKYSGHIQNIGWQNGITEGNTVGTAGKSLRLEALKISVNGSMDGLGTTTGIMYKSHIQNVGWENDWRKNGGLTGTEGQSLRMEAVMIKLYGKLAEQYDIYYRVHVEDIGWMGWAKNGEISGTVGQSYRVEALEVRLVEKDGKAPISNNEATSEKSILAEPVVEVGATVDYEAHVQNVGWQTSVAEGQTAGTVGESLRMEALKINIKSNLDDSKLDTGIEYLSHVQDVGWGQTWAKNGDLSGTVGESLRMEALRIRLYGKLAEYYDVYYRTHVENIGWMGWVKNGEVAGTTGQSLRLEAVEIKLEKK